MLRSKINREYATWWQFWLSKLPHRDTSSASRVKKAMLLRSRSLSTPEERLHFLPSPRTISPPRRPTAPKGVCIDIDEES